MIYVQCHIYYTPNMPFRYKFFGFIRTVMKLIALKLLQKFYQKIIPIKIREKIKLGRKFHIDESLAKALPEYDYGYLKPNNTKMKLFLKDFVQRRIYLTGYHEKDESLALLDLFPAGGVFLDIGANIGTYSFMFYLKAKHIYAFEATKKTLDCLCETIQINKIKNITPIFAAVHCTDGETITIYADFPDNCGGNSMHIGRNIANTVKSITIDSWAMNNNITDIAMIKMDIEGNEFNAFKGMKESLLKYRPIIFCELSPGGIKAAGSNILELFNYVTEDCNYSAKILEKNKYKEIDKKYISEMSHNKNCYFFPKNV